MSTADEKETFNRNKNIQEMVNFFLSENHMPTITERMAASGKREVIGVLTADHKIVLQQIIRQEFPDIDSRIRIARGASDGRGQILGALSATEVELTNELLENFSVQREFDQQELVQARTY